MSVTKTYTDRKPDKNGEGAPLADLIDNGEPVQVIRKKIVYEYRPLYTLAFVICFTMLTWAIAFTIEQISDGATARACFAAEGSWIISDQGARECRQR